MFGAAVYFIFDWWGQERVLVALFVGVIALVGLGYLVYQHHYPEAKLPSTDIWVWLPLVLTWCFLGYVIYVDRTVKVPPAEPLPAHILQTQMGARKDTTDHYLFVAATVNGSEAAGKYAKDYFIFIFCLTGDSRIDPGADSAIDRSKPFDLAQRQVNIEVPLGSGNTSRILKSGGIDIYLLMIPKDVDQSALQTFNEIYAHGGKLLDHKAMGVPPKDLLEYLK